MSFKSVLYVFALSWVVSACVPNKDLIYLQANSEQQDSQRVISYQREDYKLQVNDILDVKISSLNPEVNAIFNAPLQVNQQAIAQAGGDLYYMTGYSIDKNGEIDIPFVGRVNVLGQTLEQAQSSIVSKVDQFFTSYHLKVKLGGIRFSAIGEFNRPGKHVVMQNQATIFEAIALSGDLSSVAKRKNIKLIRQYPEGTRIHNINLLDQSIIASPYYFIQPNDVLYAEPMPQKSWGVGVNGAQTFGTIINTLSASLAITLSIISLTK